LPLLGFLRINWRDKPPVVNTLERWLGSWSGLGLIVEGMRRQGYVFQLSEAEQGWRSTFYRKRPTNVTPFEHRVLRFWPTPFRAVQDAAWEALMSTPPCDLSEATDSPA